MLQNIAQNPRTSSVAQLSTLFCNETMHVPQIAAIKRTGRHMIEAIKLTTAVVQHETQG